MLRLFRAIFKVKKCKTLAELRAYIKPGDLAGLWNWLDWWIPYRPDKGPADSFRPVEKVLHRAANGRGDDCEGFHAVAQAVISSWQGWDAGLVVLTRPKPPYHALCVFIRPDGVRGIINYTVHLFPDAKGWSEIFETVPGGWTGAYWVDAKGDALPTAGWRK